MYGALTIALLFLAEAIFLPLTLVAYASQIPGGAARPARFELRLAEETPAEGLIEATVDHTDKKVYLVKQVLVSNKDLIDARVVAEDGFYRIEIRFTEEGAQKMARASEAHIGKPIAILVDGKVVSAPIVRSMVSDRAAIAGAFTKDEAERLAGSIMIK